MIRHLDLFSGIGGFSLAASWTGVVEPAGFCEIDPWCRRILAKHWPEVPQHDDIKTLTGDVLRGFGRIDLVTGGWPCQPYSLAGKRLGDADDRALWPEVARVIAECRPTYVLGENTPDFANVALDGVFTDLEGFGYSCRAVVLPAAGVASPQGRHRIWIMAHAPSVFGSAIKWDESNGLLRNLCKTNGKRCQESREHQQSINPAEDRSRETDRSIDAVWWPPEPRMDRVAARVSKRVDRLRGLGNSIVPQVAYEILSVMLADHPRAVRRGKEGTG